jgi:mRNA interferase RelE/StbE
MAYRIFLRPAAIRDLDALQGDVRERIEQAIDRLTEDPRPHRSKKLVGSENEWRLRVGAYRVLYLIDDAARRILIARVAHRREAYR